MGGQRWRWALGFICRIGGKALDCCPFYWRTGRDRVTLYWQWPPMAGSAARRWHGG
jgi:hypothetical protein